MIERFERSPRGYGYLTEGKAFPQAGQSITFNSEYAYDPVVEDLWQRYLNLVGTDAPLSLVLLMVERLKHALGDFRQWVWIQATTNRAVQGYALAFILDTIKFTQSGERQMSIENWLALVEIDPPLSNTVVSSRVDQFKDIVIPDTTTLLTNWLSRENGVRDLFQSANILFGKVN